MKEAIKKFIIEKAKQIFEKKGFKDTTIEDIAKASSISIPTFYNYFPGKKDIFIEVIKSIESQLDDEVVPIFSSNLDFFSKIEGLFSKLLEFVKKNKEIVRIAFFESQTYSNLDKCDESAMWKNKEKRLSNLILLIEDGKKNGLVEKDISSESIGMFMMGIMHELFFKIIFKKNGIDTDRILIDLMIFFRKGIMLDKKI